MPALADRLTSGIDMSGYGPVATPDPSNPVSIPNTNQEPTYSPYTRCPLPILTSANSDAQRTYYQNGVVPQYRLLNPPSPPAAAPATNVTNVTQNTVQKIVQSLALTGAVANPGYIVLPPVAGLSLIIQWGITPTPTAPGVQPAITLPFTFTNNQFGVVWGPIQVSGQHTMAPAVVQGSQTTSQFTWTTGSGTDTDGLCPAFWIALGD